MRWQPPIRTLLQVQITAVQYLAHNPLTNLPEPIAQNSILFEKDVAQVMRAMANEVSEKPVDAVPVPDIRLSAERVRHEIHKYYQDAGLPVSPQASDVADLIDSLVSVLSPLYEDIQATFAATANTIDVKPQLHFS